MEENQNFSKDNNTENILTENTENTQTEAKADKHLLTLHLSHKNGSKTLHLKKGHLIAASVAALIVLGGGAYAGVSYLQTQNRLTNSQQQLAEMEKENRKLTQRTEMLENENEEYMVSSLCPSFTSLTLLLPYRKQRSCTIWFILANNSS